MKSITLTLMISIVCFFANAQKIVYNKNYDKKQYVKEDVDLLLTESSIAIPSGAELAPILAGLLPTFVDMGLSLTTKALENRVKKFSGEYSKQNSFLDAGNGRIPNVKFVRKVDLGDVNGLVNALEIIFKAEPVNKVAGFVYYIESIRLDHTAAKVNSRNPTLDYTFELKVSFIVNGEKKVVEISPMQVNSIGFGMNDFSAAPLKLKYRTDIIPLSEGAMVSEVSLKIVESNPAKVKAEKILATWNDQKESVTTIINNVLPKADEKEETAADPEAATGSKRPAPPAIN